MARRTNPWPAFVDLFSALLVITFAGFMMLSAAYQHELKRFQETESEMTKVRQEANRIIGTIQKSLTKDSALASRVRPCGEDTCIDLDLHFAEGHDAIGDNQEQAALERVCVIIKSAIDALPPHDRKDIGLVIEGHTNQNQPSEPLSPRDKYLFNWNLSGRRATSVLYKFQQCGLSAPVYSVEAIGYADSKPICTDATQNCSDKNRRTTLLLRADTHRIETRLKQGLR